MGRNAASGTRTTVFAEIGIGISAAVAQYHVNGASGIASSFTYLGDSGESGGSDVATALGYDSASLSAIIIGYAGDTDANSAVTNGQAARSPIMA